MAWCFNLGPHTASDDIPTDIRARFDAEIREHQVGTHAFRLLAVRDPDTLLEAVTPTEFAVDERLPYWAELWTSSIALAAYCLEQTGLRGARVLDLGCGLGLTGIAAAQRGAGVVFADYEEDALRFARENARMNLDADDLARCEFRVADWRDPGTLGAFDVVLGADIIYERRHFHPLLRSLHDTVGHGGEAWLAEPDRVLGSDFFALARADGWSVDIREKSVERRGRTSCVRIAVCHRGSGHDG